MSEVYPVVSREHALLCGTVAGIAKRHGVDLTRELDDDGNPLASLVLRSELLPEGVTVRLIVEPPPERS